MRERRFRKPLRYKGHDYHAPCFVHVTICTHARQPLFGTVTPDGMHLSEPGQFVHQTLLALHSDDLGVGIDAHIVMPDHVHAVIVLGTNPHVETTDSVPDVVRRFKMRVLRAWPNGITQHGWTRYDTNLWQPSYHDTLIRNDIHLEKTRQYILANPARWIERMENTKA